MLLATSAVGKAAGNGAKPDAAKAQAASDYSKEPFVVQRMDVVQRYANDGTADIVASVKTRVQTDAAVRASGLLEFSYASKQDSLEIEYLKVEKPDGRIVETPAADIQDLPMQVTREAPFYSDLRAKQIPVKGLSVGDVVEYRVHRKILHPAVEGQFWGDESFLQGAVVLSNTLEIRFPKAKYVKVVSKDVQPEIKVEGEEKVYRWKTSQLEATAAKPENTKPKKNADQPSVQFTTFHDWASVGAWYSGLQRDRVEATPDIEAKEKELTRGATTEEDKIRALYTYVATQFRYIGVDFGVGRYQPHRASEVLDNQYGDCKDKHTLLAALLKAGGFTAWPVLVNPSAKVRIDVPSPGQFNHVITLVQSGGKSFWMDSTTEVGPFQWLTPPLRGEQGLVMPTTGDAHFATLPENPPYSAKTTWDAVGTLSKEDVYTGHFDISMRDDWEVVLRTVYRNTARADWDATTAKVLGAFGFAGTVTHADPSPPEELTKPFHLAFDYERKDFGDWENYRTFPMLPLWIFTVGKDDPKPDEAFYVAMQGTMEFKSTTKMPEGFGANVPAGTNLKTDFVDYSNAYSFNKGSLLVERKFVLKNGRPEPGAWADFLRWQKAVLDDESNMVQLSAPGGSTEEGGNSEAEKMVRSAYSAIVSGDREQARRDLDEAQKVSPKEQGLWGQYGYLDALDGHYDLAMAEFQKEIEYHPGDVSIHLQLVRMFQQMQRTDDALELARVIAKSAPASTEAQMVLGNLLRVEGKTDEAEGVLEKLVSGPSPTDQMEYALARIYLKQGRKADAERLLKGILDSSADPEMLNNAAYELADANLDLDLARTVVQQAIASQEAKTATMTLDKVSKEDLSAVSALARSWDTLGWVYFRQGNFATAEGYIKPAWVLGQSQVVGDHLAEIYENQRKLALARETMDLAGMSSVRPESLSSTELNFEAKLFRDTLTLTGRKHVDNGDLSKIRSVELPIRKKNQMSADFFVLLSAKGIVAAKFISGDAGLKEETASLMKAKFDEPFPPGSNALIVRRGVMACSALIGNCQFVMLLPGDARAE
jgi:tetratricopeptide (TPR) repeat protein